MTVYEIINVLDDVSEIAPGKWKAKCPMGTHDDRHPTVTVRVGDRGPAVIMKCWSCPATFVDLIRACEKRAAGIR